MDDPKCRRGTEVPPTRVVRVIDGMDGFVAGWRFPTLLSSLLVAWPLLLLGVLMVPPGTGELAQFADQFRVWCFGYDPTTGTMELAYVVMLIVNPLVLLIVVYAVWAGTLKDAWRDNRGGMARYAALGAGFVLAAGVGLTQLSDDGGLRLEGELPFPAEALRTKHFVPEFILTDQNGSKASSADLPGQVTMITAVYASCPHTCPVILTEAKAAVEALPEGLRDKVAVYAITMDPENDGQEQLAALADMHGMEAPTWRLLTGVPGPVNALLDRFNVARARDPETGVISHSNQFILVDQNGRIAYRLALGPQQQRWLPKALELLAREKPTLQQG